MLLTLSCAELALRVLDVYPPLERAYPGEHEDRSHPTFVADAALGWRTRPGLDTTTRGALGQVRILADEAGHRTGPDRRDVGACRGTVVLAGDSFLWGVDVDWQDTVAADIEARLPLVHVADVAQPGFGLDQAVLAFEQDGVPLRPKLVVLGVYPQDCDRCMTAFRSDFGFHKPTFVLRDGALVAMSGADRPPALLDAVARGSRVLGLWQRTQRTFGFRYGIGPWWALNRALLDRLRAAAAAVPCPVLLVHIPMADWRAFPALADYARTHAVALFDPVTEWPERPADFYIPPAGHFTPHGGRLMGERIAAWIARLVPELGG